jgi:predicted nucleotidyltransferase component of viral defense system
MSSSRPANIPASVRQRLLNIAKERGEAFNLILTRYALERLLYRMSISEFRDSFLLKGAMLHSLWYDKPFRATKDLDLLGYGSAEIDAMVNTFRAICGVPAVADGVEFEPTSVRGIDIRVEDEYQGVRIVMNSTLAGAKIPLQIDIGFGDVVIPNPETVTYPTLLGFPPPTLRAYSRYSVVAEKFQAMVKLDLANSRMKDFFDVWAMCRVMAFEGAVLSKALKATFGRRTTAIPLDLPPALTSEFGTDSVKRTQWAAFLRKNETIKEKEELSKVLELLRVFLLPPTLAAANDNPFDFAWPPGGPWAEKEKGSG